MKLKKLVRLSMLISLSVVISIIESYIPILNNIVPGLRLGLSNIIILFVFFSITVMYCFIVLSGFLMSSLFSLTTSDTLIPRI